MMNYVSLRHQRGLSLVELMIAITLGLILLTGVVQVFISSKNVFSTQQAVSRIQETGRLAIEFLSRDIRMAGYMGCASRSATMEVTNTLKNKDTFDYNFQVGITGYTAATLPAGSTISPTPEPNTDIVVMRSVGSNGVEVVKNNDSAQVFVSLLGTEAGACSDGSDKVSGICQGDILVVADCVKARVFQTTNITKSGDEANLVHSGGSYTPGNDITSWGGASNPEDESFGPGSEVLVATNTAYFIAKGTSGRPSLWQNINGSNLELLEGIEDMAISYGVDTNGDYAPDDYRKAATVADWSQVVSVQIELLVASVEDNVLPETQKYSFDDEDDKDPDDRRLRQVFNSTIAIRSRLY